MRKRLIGIAVTLVMLFGVFGLVACDTQSLDEYKLAGKAEIEAYAEERKDNYSEEGWTTVCGIVDAGKTAVDEATDKAGVDTAVATAKGEIDEVDIQLRQGFYTTEDKWHSIRLHGENQFSLSIAYISHLPTGAYRVEGGKLVLEYRENDELVFEIKNGELIFVGTMKDGIIVEEGLVKVGTIFTKSFYEVETEDMVECSKFHYSIAMSSLGAPIELFYLDETAVFECSTNIGGFNLTGAPYYTSKEITVQPNNGFYWRPEQGVVEAAQIYISVVLKVDENIVGYAVIEIENTNSSTSFVARMIKAAEFPKQDNAYQNISLNYVQENIEKIIESEVKA